MNAFKHYLELHEIDPIRLSMEAKVRYLIIWNAMKGNPITPASAQKIKDAVLRLTGVPYTDSLVLIQAEPPKQLPVIPIKKLHSKMKRTTYHVSCYCRSGIGS